MTTPDSSGTGTTGTRCIDQPHSPASITSPSPRRWWMLFIGTFAQTAQAILVNGAAFLIPQIQAETGMSLARIGLLVAAPTLGVMLSLVAWGALADRVGERTVLATGMALAAGAGSGAALSGSIPMTAAFLLLGGMTASSANAASGRVVVGWFPPARRGLAMGIRQMALPLGVACAALTLPTIARAHGIEWAMALPAAVCAIAALTCALFVIDPPRPDRGAAAGLGLLTNPYRRDGVLVRIHIASALLSVPQYVVWTFALVWLITEQHQAPTTAGLLITVAQITGGLARIAVGVLSDALGSRLRPLRWVAGAGAVSMTALALTDQLGSPTAIAVLLIASIVTVAPNGLSFTAVAELGGPFWGGRALGVHNTGQFIAASLVPPAFGAVIGFLGYPAAFAIAAGFAAASVPLTPHDPDPSTRPGDHGATSSSG